MKEMSKARVLNRKNESQVMNEIQLLSYIKSDFVINAHYAFQDKEFLYLILDLLLGGDLRYHMNKRRKSMEGKFSEEVTKFFIACLILALEDTHALNIVHRDIKPENLVFDNQRYLRLTDFAVASPVV